MVHAVASLMDRGVDASARLRRVALGTYMSRFGPEWEELSGVGRFF